MSAGEQLTQAEAMDRLGVSRYMIRKLEREEGLPRTEAGYPWPEIREWLEAFEEDGRPTRLTQVEVAERLGLSTRQVRRLADAGIPRDGDGYPWPEVRDWYNEFKRREAQDRAAGGSDIRQAFLEARTRKEAANADLHELDLAKRRAAMLHREDLPELFSGPLTRLEGAVRELPDRIAVGLCPDGVLPETPLGEVASLIRDEVHDFLEELCEEVPF